MENVSARFMSSRQAERQALFSLGDRRIGRVLLAMAQGESFGKTAKTIHSYMESILYTEKSRETVFPWDFIEAGPPREFLYEEYMRGKKGILTPPCRDGCTLCGIC